MFNSAHDGRSLGAERYLDPMNGRRRGCLPSSSLIGVPWVIVQAGVMVPLIEEKHQEIAELCRRFGVTRLFLFGSAAAERFQASSSDLDFIVEMTDRQPNAVYADRYLGFAEALERLFGRSVDVITEQSIRNPYFRRELEATRQLVYGRPLQEAPL